VCRNQQRKSLSFQRQESQDHEVHPGYKDLQESPVLKENKDETASMAWMVSKVNQEMFSSFQLTLVAKDLIPHSRV